MDQVADICIVSLKIVVLILGMVGLCGSFLLMLWPDVLQSVGNWFDKNINIEGTLSCLNRYVRTDRFIYRHNILIGLALFFGSMVVLFFLFFGLPESIFQNVVFEVLTLTAIWIGKIGGILGVWIGAGLMFFPSRISSFETRLNLWCETQSLVDKLNEPYSFIDHVLLRYSVIFGITGMASSAFLVLIAAISLTR